MQFTRTNLAAIFGAIFYVCGDIYMKECISCHESPLCQYEEKDQKLCHKPRNEIIYKTA